MGGGGGVAEALCTKSHSVPLLSSGLTTCQSRREWDTKAGKGLFPGEFCVLGTPERPAPGGTVLFPTPHPCCWASYPPHTTSWSSPSPFIHGLLLLSSREGAGEFSSCITLKAKVPRLGEGHDHMLVIQSAPSTYSRVGWKPGWASLRGRGSGQRTRARCTPCPPSGPPPALCLRKVGSTIHPPLLPRSPIGLLLRAHGEAAVASPALLWSGL